MHAWDGIEREFWNHQLTLTVNKQSSIIIYGEKEIAWLEKSLSDPGTELPVDI